MRARRLRHPRRRSGPPGRFPFCFTAWLPVAFVALCLAAPAAAAVTITDDRGRAVTLDRPAGRIVSLAPHLTELLFAAGAGDRLVATVEYSDYPAAARRLPRIGDASRVDLERIVALAPDLIVAWKSGNAAEDIAQMERLGLAVFVTEPVELARIPDQIETLGRLAGTSAAATVAAARFRARLAALRRRYAGREPVTVFYQVWDRPLMTVNGRHFISDALRLCGGRNPFADLEPAAPVVSVEAVIAADPLAIVGGTSGAQGVDGLALWRRWPTMTAVRLGNLFTIPSDLIARPTPRILEGVRFLCEALDKARAGTDDR